MRQFYEIYFDKSEDDEPTNDNYSVIVSAEHKPQKKAILKKLAEIGKVLDGYHIIFIADNGGTWGDEPANEIVYLL